MGLAISIFATVLVLFMVVAMAMAEWADKDPGDLLSVFWKRRKSTDAVPAKLNAAVQMKAKEKSVASRAPKSAGKVITGASKGLSAKAPGKNTVVRKPTIAKRKPK
jgi:hypothetical protein